MKVRLIDVTTTRSDGRPGGPTGVTLGFDYVVAEVLPHTEQYSIMNDDGRLCRYSMSRFVVVDDSPVPPLRQNFNTLTAPLRLELKRLQERVAALEVK